jgi:hypothetical protein
MVYSYQLLVYADDANILGGSTRTIIKHEALVVASKEIGPLMVNAEKNSPTADHAGHKGDQNMYLVPGLTL